jgi:hypothetical protein
LWFLLARIKTLTHLPMEEIFNDGQAPSKNSTEM